MRGNLQKALGIGSPTDVKGSVLVAQDVPSKTEGKTEAKEKEEVGNDESSQESSEDHEELDHPDEKSVPSDEKGKEGAKPGNGEVRKSEKGQEQNSVSERARAREQIRATHEAKMQRILARARGTAVEAEILALPSLKLQELEAKLSALEGRGTYSKEEAKILREAILEELQYLHRQAEASL